MGWRGEPWHSGDVSAGWDESLFGPLLTIQDKQMASLKPGEAKYSLTWYCCR